MNEVNKATARQRKNDKKNTFRPSLKFNNNTDADIKDWLERIKELNEESVQGYIKRLIRTDIRNQKSKKMGFENYMKKSRMDFTKMPESKNRKKED